MIFGIKRPLRWRLRDLPIAAKLGLIAAVFGTITLGLIVLLTQALDAAAGVRSFIAAEGQWSKGQKDAVFFLSRYLRSRDEPDFAAFRQAIAIPLGDRKARLEMEKPQFDDAAATRGFIDGGNPPADIPYMIALFRRAYRLGVPMPGAELWRAGELQVLELCRLGDEIHAAAAAGTLAPEQDARYVAAIDRVNLLASMLERQLSTAVAQTARDARRLLLRGVASLSLAMLALGLLISWRVSADLRRSVRSLRDGALRVMGGDLDVRVAGDSRDELGQFADVFDEMVRRRREAERALRAATEINEAIMQNATDAIYVIGGDMCLSVVNQRTCELTGYPRGQLLGMPWSMLVPPEHAGRLADTFERVLRDGSIVRDQEVPMLRRDLNVRTVRFSAAPLRRDGAVFAIVGSAEDITERRRAEAEFSARAAELTRSNRELEQFAYVASHDLQEPLRSVTSFTQLLSRRYRGRLDSEADGFIDAISQSVLRMKSLIDDLLAYSSVTFDPKDIELAAFDDIFADACASLSAAIDATGANVTCGALPSLRVNRRQIRQLLQHLIGNALKFHDGSPPKVHLDARPLGNEWLFSVRDEGIGIDPSHFERIFGLFQRLHERADYPGNGIGLTLCKKVVELHGGRIWVEAGNPGSVFKFTLRADR
ncbi:MAG: PAS domain S-box protein [Nevskia sp.]|nr:PAS domain S-box protein [Nevskia sp.]